MKVIELQITTEHKREVIDITDKVVGLIEGANAGVATVFVQHTTAAVTIADLDPGTDQDLLDALDGLLPDLPWRHPHDPAHTPDHLLASIIGPSIGIPYQQGRLQLGSWQRIILIDFDGPRTRNLTVVV